LPQVIEVKREEHASEEKLGLKFLNLVRSDVSLVPFHEFSVKATSNGRPYAIPPAAVQVADEKAVKLEAIELENSGRCFPWGGLPRWSCVWSCRDSAPYRSFPLSDSTPSELSFGDLVRATGKVQVGAGGELSGVGGRVAIRTGTPGRFHPAGVYPEAEIQELTFPAKGGTGYLPSRRNHRSTDWQLRCNSGHVICHPLPARFSRKH